MKAENLLCVAAACVFLLVGEIENSSSDGNSRKDEFTVTAAEKDDTEYVLTCSMADNS